MLGSPTWCTWLSDCHKPWRIWKALSWKPPSSGGGWRKGLWEERLLPESGKILHSQSSVFRVFYGIFLLLYRRRELQRIFTMRVEELLKRSRGEATETTSFEVLKTQKGQDWPDVVWAITPLHADWTTALQNYFLTNISRKRSCFILLPNELMRLTEGHIFSAVLQLFSVHTSLFANVTIISHKIQN